ncbi:MAG: aminotransferase class I/II-fold pyridoxal phosphate-dependent enzyme [Planctomycetota bacterium]|jgi:histidinol-phosphate aminotransferase
MSGLKPSPRIAGRAAYRKPTPRYAIDLHLDGNEGAAPPAGLVDSLRDELPELMRRYPNPRALEERIAKLRGVGPERVIVTAGVDDAIDRAFRAMIDPGRQVILPEPTFAMFRQYATTAGADVVSIPWPEGPYPTDKVLSAVRPETAVIVVVSPNSPSGAVVTAADLQKLSKAAPDKLILVDLAYVEFADVDLTDEVIKLPNAVAMRTLSKAWGMAGLRVGYAIGPAEVIGWMRTAGAPYANSTVSLALAAARLESGEREVRDFVAVVRKEREELTRLLGALPSQANFVLAAFDNKDLVRDGLMSLGIAVRDQGLENRLRITLPGDGPSFARLTSALGTVLEPEAILFDLDGVLADVSQSYREAILKTGEAFGVKLDPAEVSKAKVEENANNDWEVTRRLLARNGVEVSLEEVTKKFEGFYQELCKKEKLTTDRATLERLKLPIGVVTGRPRKDAERFLKDAGIADLVKALVCMEDAPAKPDPAPVRRALERLGVKRAWMVGDTPDDLRAARAAGVLPVGMPPAGVETFPRDALAGAAVIVDNVGRLEEMIP